MPSIQWCLKEWETWKSVGFEWPSLASHCHQTYSAWKNSIVECFISNHVTPETSALEIAPGQGRWTHSLADRVKQLAIADLNPKCIDFCKKEFRHNDNITFHVNNGKDLDFINKESIDFIFSFDSFVHMDIDVIESYIKEFHRVLKSGGKAVIHHAECGKLAEKYLILRNYGPIGKRAYSCVTPRIFPGQRSAISNGIIQRLVRENHLIIDVQRNAWGDQNQFDCKLFNDSITEMSKR